VYSELTFLMGASKEARAVESGGYHPAHETAEMRLAVITGIF
jgi:hypothetical protein